MLSGPTNRSRALGFRYPDRHFLADTVVLLVPPLEGSGVSLIDGCLEACLSTVGLDSVGSPIVELEVVRLLQTGMAASIVQGPDPPVQIPAASFP